MSNDPTYHQKANRLLKRVSYITNQEHDQGLLVCQNYRHLISEEEFLAINYLCMAYGNDEGCDRDYFETAMAAIRRVRESIK